MGEGVELAPGTFFSKGGQPVMRQVLRLIILFPWQMDCSELKLEVSLNEKETAKQLHQV